MLERSRVLIVDDEPFNVDYLEQELEDLGYETIIATNDQEALAKVASGVPELILLDVMMPGMDGFTVCWRLKEQREAQLIPVVIMTARGAREDRIKGIEAGADDFLTKPVNPRELRARIRTAVKMKQAADRKFGELRRITDHFAKFVPEVVKRLVTANPQAPELALHEQDLSVLFVDISSYSRLCEQLPLNTLNALVERYFSSFLDRIQEAGGDVNETAGDGFMAIFQDADIQMHARKAVDTALILLITSAALNRKGNEPPLSIHIGINSGVALVGAVRFEGLRGSRWTFTDSGSVTNLAARLAEAAEANQILVGPRTIRRLGNGYRFDKVGRQHLKNLADAIDVYRVLGPSS